MQYMGGKHYSARQITEVITNAVSRRQSKNLIGNFQIDNFTGGGVRLSAFSAVRARSKASRQNTLTV